MRWRLFLVAWLAGLIGIIAVTWLWQPALLEGRQLPLPMWMVLVASATQSAMLLALAVWAGVVLAPKVGLSAPALTAMAQGRSPLGTLRRQWLPGIFGGVAGASLLWALAKLAPAPLLHAQARFAVPLPAAVLYGGITEELLLRWGFMTFMVWLLWRVFRRGRPAPSGAISWAGIAVSAILFGVGHLPAASAVVGHLSAGLITYIVAGNAAFGVLAGWLYWRFGLESAMLAHALSHLLFRAVTRLT